MKFPTTIARIIILPFLMSLAISTTSRHSLRRILALNGALTISSFASAWTSSNKVSSFVTTSSSSNNNPTTMTIHHCNSRGRKSLATIRCWASSSPETDNDTNDVEEAATSTDDELDFLVSDDVKLSQIMKFRGTVDQGYGRGGKKLGVPTANLPASLFQNALESVDTGVYFGYATLENDSQVIIHKAVVNVGYSPTFEGKENKEKIIEAHLILDDDEKLLDDFYGVTMRLKLIGYLRPEQKFDSFPDLIRQIHADISNAKTALSDMSYYTKFQDDTAFFSDKTWIGQTGGNDQASWEFVSPDQVDSGDSNNEQEIIGLQQSVSSKSIEEGGDDTSSSKFEDMTSDEFLKHQEGVFDKMSTWFGTRSKEVTSELEPVYQAMVDDILAQTCWNTKMGMAKDDNENGRNNNDPIPLSLLDVACGTGVLWEFMANSNQKLTIQGVDLSSKMVDLASEKAKMLEDCEISVIQSDILSYCKENNDVSYDGILLNACFGNFFNPRKALEALFTSSPKSMICVSHPLGASFVRKLHYESPETVPHLLPETLSEATKLIHGLPCVTSSLQCPPTIDDETAQRKAGDYYLWTMKACRAKGLSEILRFRGTVDEGYGRGGKKLGVPTANLPASLFQNALEGINTGVYFGWTSLEQGDEGGQDDRQVYKAVVNVGYSPTFEGRENPEKIIEAHLILADIPKTGGSDEESSTILPDFYGVPMRLQLIGYLRPEQKFDSFPKLIAQIHADIEDAKNSLDDIPYTQLQNDDFLTSPGWLGSSGGDEQASWEFVPAIDEIAKVLSKKN